MNRGARLVVLYSEHLRSVMLVRGEATFTVAHEALRPFDLTVGNRHFGTLAATFNVRMAGRDAMELTVLEGTVTLLPSPASDTSDPTPTALTAAQTIDIESGKESARTLSEREAQARIGWHRG
jgi:transmembrane sensor